MAHAVSPHARGHWACGKYGVLCQTEKRLESNPDPRNVCRPTALHIALTPLRSRKVPSHRGGTSREPSEQVESARTLTQSVPYFYA